MISHFDTVQRPNVESEQTPYTRQQVNRALLKLREDCEIQEKRILARHQREEVGPGAIAEVVDRRIRQWLEKQVRSGRYADVYMEQSRSPRHPCGDVTLVTTDGLAVTFIHPTSVLGFHYILPDIQKAFPLRVFCAPEVADQMQAETRRLSDLHGLLEQEWSIHSKPALGLVPVELDPKAFTEETIERTNTTLRFKSKSRSKSKLTRVDPTLESVHRLEAARIGHVIQLVDPSQIAGLILIRPELTSNEEFA